MKEYFESMGITTNLPGVQLRSTNYRRFGFPRHFHNYYTLIVPGTGIIKETGGYELHPGMVFFFGPGDVHAGEAKTPDDVSFRSIVIEATSMARLLEEVLPEFRFGKTLVHDERTRRIVCQLMASLAEDSPVSKVGSAEEQLIDLFHQLSVERPDETTWADTPFVAKAKDFLRDNYREHFSLQDLASVCHRSPYHLSRSFKKQTGMSPFAYLHNYRVERAKSELQNATWARTAVANGFYDQSHFYRHFKRLNGVPPGRWHESQ